MEKIAYNKNTNLFELYYVENESEANSANVFDIKNMIASGTLKAIIDYKVSTLSKDIFGGWVYGSPFRKEIGNLIILAGIKKSNTKKSVHQYIPYGSETFNLPEEFRTKRFNSIIAITRGPFLKRKIGDRLFDAEPWYLKEVIFVGTLCDCISFVCKSEVHTFLLNDVLNLNFLPSSSRSLEELEFIQKSIIDITDQEIESQINSIISPLYEELQNDCLHDTNNDDDYNGWAELGEEEERNMDEETDGSWRWNID